MIFLGQNFRFGFYDVPPKERIRGIRQAGFDSVMFWWGDEFEDTDGSRYDLIRCAFDEGLSVNTNHFPSTHADYLWRPERQEGYLRQLIAAIEDCSRFGVENLVVHTTRALITPPYNETGLGCFARALHAAEREGVNLALENTRFPAYNDYIYRNLSSPRLRLCYDTGHENTYTPGADILSMFGDRLSTTHIHDNDGQSDQHYIIGEGNIDFPPIFRRLAERGLKYYNLESYCLETSRYYGHVSMDGFLAEAHKRLTDLVTGSGAELGHKDVTCSAQGANLLPALKANKKKETKL